MSLNSSSGGSTSHPMTHRAKQQSMNAQRREANALKNHSRLNEEDELIKILPLRSENIKKGAHSKIIYILETKVNPNGDHIKKPVNYLGRYILPIKSPIDDILTEYPYIDMDGFPHTTMKDVQKANDEINRIGYPEKINNQDLIRKTPESPYFLLKKNIRKV